MFLGPSFEDVLMKALSSRLYTEARKPEPLSPRNLVWPKHRVWWALCFQQPLSELGHLGRGELLCAWLIGEFFVPKDCVIYSVRTTSPFPPTVTYYRAFLTLRYTFSSLKSLKLSCCCSAAKLCLIVCNSMDYSMAGFPVLQYLLELTQTHVHWVSEPHETEMGLRIGGVIPNSFLWRGENE